MTNDILISLNGEQRAVPTGTTVAALLEIFSLPAKRIAIEHNQTVLPKSAWAETPLNQSDRLEIVHFVGGG